MGMQLRVNLGKEIVELLDSAINSCVLGVHGAEKAIPNLTDHYVEAEEEVTFEILVEELIW